MRALVRTLAHFLLGSFPFVSSPSEAMAATAYAETMEWLTADADVVVRGVISEIRRGASHGPVPLYYEATMKVAETLRGDNKGELAFAVSTFPATTPDELFRWRDGQTELLLFLRASQRYSGNARISPPPCPLYLRFASSGWEAVPLDDAKANRGVATMTFRMLIDRDEILTAARKGVAESPSGQRAKPLGLDAPGSSEVHGRFYRGSEVKVVVPIDRRSEEQAGRWAKAGNYFERYDAIKVLRHFRSDENIAVLKGLLYDRSGVTSDGRIRWNIVRRDAYKLLCEWGVEVEEPGFEEPPPRSRK